MEWQSLTQLSDQIATNRYMDNYLFSLVECIKMLVLKFLSVYKYFWNENVVKFLN